MIEWEATDDGLRVADAEAVELLVRSETLSVEGPGSGVGRPVDVAVAVTARELRFPNSVVHALSLGHDRRQELDPAGNPLELSRAEYLLDVDAGIKTYLRFAGEATVERSDDFEHVVVSFPDRRRAVLGFRSRHELPAGRIVTPPEPAALASALTKLASALKTTGPDRSYPTLRGHPPLLAVGEEPSVPAGIDAECPETGIEIVVEPTLERLFVVAPLAYYLGATVRVGDHGPFVRAPEMAVERPIEPDAFDREVARLLRRCFFLDSLVRNAGPYGTELAELSMLDALELDPEELYRASPPERLAAYLEVPHAAVEHRLPDWHLATYVDPEPTTVEAVPFLLDRMSLIFPARTTELEGRELIERSLADFYRPGAGEVASVDIVKPELREGRLHGWLAGGVPIDVFNASPTAYHNRLERLRRHRESISIRVVVNDPEMGPEGEDVTETFHGRAEELPIELTVEEGLSTAELARALEDENEFLHFVGHCEVGGLRCPDGTLATSSLDRCGAETFFLNACGSFYEGRELIERGGVAGAVTVATVLDEHAVTVGTTFARLLVYGFSVERALGLARRRIMMGKDYTVVGDGTHSLTGDLPTTVRLERFEGGFGLTLDCFSAGEAGRYYVPHVEGNHHSFLCGTESTFVVDRTALSEFLREIDAPVIYDGDLYWSTELSPAVADGQGPP